MATTVSERKLARRLFDQPGIWLLIQAILAELNRQLSGEYERLSELAAVPVRQHDRAMP